MIPNDRVAGNHSACSPFRKLIGCRSWSIKKAARSRFPQVVEPKSVLDDLDRERIALRDLRHNVQPLSNLAEARVIAVQMRRRLAAVYNEELRPTGVASGVSHGQHAQIVVLVIAVQFAVDGVAGTAVADAVGAATLCHESGNDTVKLQAFVEAVLREFDEVGDRVWSVLFKEFHGHGAAVGGDFCVHGESFVVNEKASRSGRLFVERETRLELATPTLARLCSTN